MNLVLNNPFRVLGLPVTASERDIAKRISDLEIFAEMGKPASYDTDFLFLSDFPRTPESVRQAFSRIERPDGRLYHALFWFWENSDTDQRALALLGKGDVRAAMSLWGRYAEQKVTGDNYSAIRNLGILYMGLSGGKRFPGSERQAFLSKGLRLAGRLFASPFFEEYCRVIAGEGQVPDKTEMGKAFADEVIAESQKAETLEGMEAGKLMDCFRGFPEDIFSHVAEKFARQPMRRIEAEIEQARKKRTTLPQDAQEIGKHLCRTTLDDLRYLRSLFSRSDLRYQLISDRLSNEILQCGIDFFNASAKGGSGRASGESALKLIKHADEVAGGDRVKARVAENLSLMEAWLRAAPQRKRRKETELLIDDIAKQLNAFPERTASAQPEEWPEMARGLFEHCIGKLLLVRTSPDAGQDIFLNLSSALANHISELCVRYAAQTGGYSEAIRLMESVSTLDMVPEIRERHGQVNEMLTRKREEAIFDAMRESSPEKKKACYIATMVYGKDAPQTFRLREFRDRRLGESVFGRAFIRTYYRYSPRFVAKFGHSAAVRRSIRALLELFLWGIRKA